jgi:hypothetical protein
MAKMASNSPRAVKASLTFACVLALLVCVQVGSAGARVHRDLTSTPTDPTPYSVTLEQCATSTVQTERSATFIAQMSATGATQRMGMRIELQRRVHGETEFHTILAPGFGVWRSSEPGVKIYKYFKQVTNLTAPAAYRAIVHFRWLGEHGHVLKRAELHTTRCLQPALSGQVTQTPAPATS